MKKIVMLLSVVLCAGSNNSLIGAQAAFNDFCNMPEFGTLRKVAAAAGIGAVLFAGNKAKQLNEEYTKEKKRPDLKMRLWKAVGGMAIIVGTDILTGDMADTRKNMIKMGAATIALFAVVTPAVAKAARHIPVVGGYLTDPYKPANINKGKGERERTDGGAFIRGLLFYMPLSALGMKYLP